MPVSKSSISIRPGTIEDAVAVEQGIPEFAPAKSAADYESRIGEKPHLILVAWDGEQPIAYKVGYEEDAQTFYSWVGAVLPAYRRLGLAQQLMELQELWVQSRGYTQIRVKSMNKFPGMLILLIKNGYKMVDIDCPQEPDRAKILFAKRV